MLVHQLVETVGYIVEQQHRLGQQIGLGVVHRVDTVKGRAEDRHQSTVLGRVADLRRVDSVGTRRTELHVIGVVEELAIGDIIVVETGYLAAYNATAVYAVGVVLPLLPLNDSIVVAQRGSITRGIAVRPADGGDNDEEYRHGHHKQQPA